MDKLNQEISMSENRQVSRTNTMIITLIIVAGVVALACIAAFTAIALGFFSNPPW